MIRVLLYYSLAVLALFLLFTNSETLPDWLYLYKTSIAVLILWGLTIYRIDMAETYTETGLKKLCADLDKQDITNEEQQNINRTNNEDFKTLWEKIEEIEKKLKRIDILSDAVYENEKSIEYLREFLPENKEI